MTKWAKKWELENYESVRRWMNQVGSKTGSLSTKRNYLYYLLKFCKKTGKNPDELIKERKKHLKSAKEEIVRNHEELLMEHFNELDKSSSRSNSNTNFNAIRSFYKANYVDLKLRSPAKWTTFTDKVPSLEDIKKMIDASESPLQKAVILFSAQSGQRAGVIAAITYGMVREQLESNEKPICINVSADIKAHNGERVNKHRQKYCFFVGRDAVDALKIYFEQMRILGYKFTDESPLFITDRKYRKFAENKNKTATFKPLDREALNKLVKRAAVKAGLMDQEGVKTADGKRRFPIHHHCLRKFWQTAMEQTGIAKPWYEYMMGHSLGELDRAYSNPSIEQLKEAYERSERYLSISHINVPEIEQMKKEMLLEVIKREAQMFGIDPMKIKIEKEKIMSSGLSVDDEIQGLQSEILKFTKENRNNLQDHKIITEDELTNYLNGGWEIVRELNSGKIVVRMPQYAE